MTVPVTLAEEAPPSSEKNRAADTARADLCEVANLVAAEVLHMAEDALVANILNMIDDWSFGWLNCLLN